MKRTGLRRTAALALALILSVGTCFAGCGEKLRETGGVVKTQDGQKTYRHASTTYEAVEVGKKVGTLTDTGGGSGTVYAIEGLSADEWLVTEEGYVLYADGVHLPTLTEMKPDAVQVCAYRQSICAPLRGRISCPMPCMRIPKGRILSISGWRRSTPISSALPLRHIRHCISACCI